MANKITFEEFKNILDYIEQRQPDDYSSLYLYVNEYMQNAKVFKHKVDEEEVRTIADAVVIQQSVQLVDSEHRYELPVVRDSQWANSQGKEPKDPIKVYDAMLSGYANAEKVMYAICRAYGVILDENFKYIDTNEYNNILRIIASFYTDLEDVSVQPFGAKKYSSTEYLSYYPVYIIYQVGKYLNDLGIFNENVIPYQPSYKLDYTYDNLNVMSKSKVIILFNTLLDYLHPSKSYVKPVLQSMFNLIISIPDIDWENELVLMTFNGETAGNAQVLVTSNKNIGFSFGYSFQTVLVNSIFNDKGYKSSTIAGLYTESSDSYYRLYNIRCNTSLESTYSKSTYSWENRRFISFNSNGNKLSLSNLECFDRPIVYRYDNSATINSSSPQYRLGYLDLTKDVNIDSIKTMNLSDFEKCIVSDFNTFNFLVSNYNIELNEGDLAFWFCNAKYTPSNKAYHDNNKTNSKLVIIKNLKTFKLSSESSTGSGRATFAPISISNRPLINCYNEALDSINGKFYGAGYGSYSSYTVFYKILSVEPFDVYEYTYNAELDTTTKNEYKNTQDYNFNFDSIFRNNNDTSGYGLSCNIGEVITPTPKPDWFKLESGATYPQELVNVEDLATIYPDWVAKSFRSHSPYYTGNVDEEVLTGIATVDWVPLSMADNISSQADAQAGLIDVDNYEVILEKIEKTEEDVDENETKNKPKKNIGDTPNIPDIGNLVSVIGQGGMNQYYLNATQLGDIFESLFSLTPTTVVQNLFGNPLDFIVSLQLTYLNPVTGNTEPVKVGPYTLKTDDVEHVPHPVSALPVSEEYISIDCGSVDLAPYFDTYLDYTASSCQLFLPFVGFVSVDFSEFLTGKMHIKAIADTLTGLIVYFIICEKDGTTQTLYQFNGNCQQQIPLNGANMGRFMGDVLKGVASYAMSDNLIPSLNLPQINVSRSGSMEANVGIMTQKTPYIIIKRNAEYNANKLETLTGFPSNNYVKLANCAGYQKIKSVHTSSVNATQEEKDMIESILKSGVIV